MDEELERLKKRVAELEDRALMSCPRCGANEPTRVSLHAMRRYICGKCGEAAAQRMQLVPWPVIEP